jgi:hypothetical protein
MALRRIHPSTGALAWPFNRLIDFDPEIGLSGLIVRNSVMESVDTDEA